MGVEGGTLFLLLAFKVSSQGPWDFVILCFGGNHCTCVGGNSSVLGGLTFHLCSSWVEYWFFLFGMVVEAFHGERGEGGGTSNQTRAETDCKDTVLLKQGPPVRASLQSRVPVAPLPPPPLSRSHLCPFPPSPPHPRPGTHSVGTHLAVLSHQEAQKLKGQTEGTLEGGLSSHI